MTDIICVSETHYQSILNRAMQGIRSDFDKTHPEEWYIRSQLISEAEQDKYPLDFISQLKKDNV
jgi:hypothetical protein